MEKLRVGVIGTGRIAEGSHLPCLVQFPDVELVLCEVVEERLQAVAKQFGIRETRTDYHEMLERDKPDAVFVLTPPAGTYSVARDCLEAGVATLMEKPPGMTTDETRDMLAVARRSRAPAMVGLNRRFQPLINRAKAMVEANGPIATVIVEFYHFHFGILRSLGTTEKVIQNVLTTGCIHSIDLIRYLCGNVTEVYADVNNYYDEQLDSFIAMLRFENGATGIFHNHFLGEVRAEKLTMHGRRASAFLEGLATKCVVHQDDYSYELKNVQHADPSAPQGAVGRPINPYINGWWDQDRYFIDCVKEGRAIGHPAANLEEAVRSMELIDLIRAGTRGPVAERV
jgi:virulence factor